MKDNKDIQEFGKRLKDIRKQKKLTQANLAEKIELSNNFVGMVERGRRNTTIEKMFLIIHALDISPAEFFKTMK